MKAIGTGHSRACSGATSRCSAAADPRNCGFMAPPASPSPGWGRNRALLTITHAQTLAMAHVILVGR